MKIKFGAIVTDGRGKLGGHVASKNRGGSYLRTKVTPSNPQTAFQSAVRSLLGFFSVMWSGLTSAQRDSFNGAVAQWTKTDIFGDIKNPTGKNLFTRLNINASNVGFANILTAPEKVEIAFTPASSVLIDISSSTVDLVDFLGSATDKVLVSATPPQSAGTSFYKGKFRQLYFAPANADVIADIYDAYLERFGAIALGMNIAFEIKVVAPNGQTSVPQSYVATIQA